MLFSAYSYIKFISMYHQELLNHFPEKAIQKTKKWNYSFVSGGLLNGTSHFTTYILQNIRKQS